MRASKHRPRGRPESRRGDGGHQAEAAARSAEKTSCLGPEGLLHLQRLVGNAAVGELLRRQQSGDAATGRRGAVSEVLRSPGRALAAPLRADMEGLLGADFSAVRIHQGTLATRAAAQVGATAFTAGDHIVVTDQGTDRRTLAHELTHVIQQRSGPVAGTSRGDGLRISDPSDRFERAAEETAARVPAGPRRPCGMRRPRGTSEGEHAARSRQKNAAAGRPTLQRHVTIRFETPKHELDEFEPAEAKIIDVEATREAHLVGVEDKSPQKNQRAHVTSDTVFQTMLTRLLHHKTYVEAWEALEEQFAFLGRLLQRWYKSPVWAEEDRKGPERDRVVLVARIDEAVEKCKNAQLRGGFSIRGPLFGVRPTTGDEASREWRWYDHDPRDEVDPTEQIKQWKLLLSHDLVLDLQQTCEQWVRLRGMFPWTSLDTTSHNSSDRTGPRRVEEAAAKAAEAPDAMPNEAQVRSMCDAMLLTFDFRPRL